VNDLGCVFGSSVGANIYNDRSGQQANCAGMDGEQKIIFTRGQTGSGEG
jgi:hypothetical protein